MKNQNDVFVVSWGSGKQEFEKEPKALSFANGKVGKNHHVTINKVTTNGTTLWYSWMRGVQTVKKGRTTRNAIAHPQWQDKEKKNPKFKGN